jgi:YVTN family beta-propeller protein
MSLRWLDGAPDRPMHILAFGATVALLAACGSTPAATQSVSASGIAVGPSPVVPERTVSPARSIAPFVPSADILASVAVPGNPNGMVGAFGSIWVSSRHQDAVYRIDPTTDAVTARISVGAEPSYFAADADAVWVVESGTDAIARIDPVSGAVHEVTLGSAAYDGPMIAIAAGAVWAATEDPAVVKVDPTKLEVVGRIALPGAGNTAESEPEFVVTGGYIWVCRRIGSGDIGGIRRYDVKTLKLVDTLLADQDPTLFGLGVDGSTVWVDASGGASATGPLLQLDAKSGAVLRRVPRPTGGYGGPVLTNGRLWLDDPMPNGFASMDSKTGQPGPVQTLLNRATYGHWFLDLGPHELWISDWDNNTVFRVDPGGS